MVKYIKAVSIDESEYQGFEPWDTQELIDELNKYIRKTKITASNNLEYRVDTIFVSDRFEDAVYKMIKKHKTELLTELRDTIISLVTHPTSKTKGSHSLSRQNNPYKLNDLHLEHKNVILLYRYAGKASLVVDLQLVDLTDHKNLDKDMNKSYNLNKEIEIDDNLEENLNDYLGLSNKEENS